MNDKEQIEEELTSLIELLAERYNIKWIDANVTWHDEAGAMISIKEIEQ